MPEPIPAFLAMHHFEAPPRITVAQPGGSPEAMAQAQSAPPREDKFDLLEVASCGSFDQKSQSDTDADDFKDLSPEKTSEKAIERYPEDQTLSPEERSIDAMLPSEATVVAAVAAPIKIGSDFGSDKERKESEVEPEVSRQTENDSEAKQAPASDDVKQDTLSSISLPEATEKQSQPSVMPALMLSRIPGPRADDMKGEVTAEIVEVVKSEVSAQLSAVQKEMASLKSAMDALLQEFQSLRIERQTNVQPASPLEDLADWKGSVKQELHDVQEVLNSELKDLTSHFKEELQQLSDKLLALEAVDTQLSQTITAVRLDSAALHSAFEETRPAVANLAAAQSALGSAQRETEKQLNASILRQKSDALALNARVKDIESGWRGLLGCYCKRRRPTEAAFKPSELSKDQMDPQQIPAERLSVSIDAD